MGRALTEIAKMSTLWCIIQLRWDSILLIIDLIQLKVL